MLTGLEPDAARQLAIELIEVGLGEDMGFGHLRLDPGLPPYLLGELTVDETEALRSRWAEAMAGLTGYLYQERSKDARLASQLTLLELPNLLAMLDWLQARWPPERVVGLAQSVEQLVAQLGRPQALARATRVRELAAEKLGEWSHARYLTESAQIDRLLERGDLPAAHAATQQLLAKCLAAGEAAFSEAAYDIAMAHVRLGRVLQMSGAAEDALAPLAEAQRRFQELADAGNPTAERMAAVTFTEIGDCLVALGRLEEAVGAYEERIRRALGLGDHRGAAVARFQLGNVRLQKKRYKEALEIYAEARDAFAALGEPQQVATVWHQSGMVHQRVGQFEPAEEAYRQSLAISVRKNNLGGQAATLNQLGNLYDSFGRLEEAVTFYRQAAEAYVRFQDFAHEGVVRSNLADKLIKLRHYDEARQELQRAIECKQPFGHAAELWKTWSILGNLERATGHAEAAQAARQQAIETYVSYRRAGGVSQSPVAQLYTLVTQAIQENTEDEARQGLAELAARPDIPRYISAVIPRLQAILSGDRNPALAADPELDYDDASELQLLLERVTAVLP
jgi:tetratricopeptide (TPR) repeat protein